MAQTMIERVAEAEAKVDGYADLLAMSRPQRERYMLRARAAIEAMREPTNAMIDAAYFGDAPGEGKGASGYYQAMIDAALTEG